MTFIQHQCFGGYFAWFGFSQPCVALFILLRERKLTHRKSWPHTESVISRLPVSEVSVTLRWPHPHLTSPLSSHTCLCKPSRVQLGFFPFLVRWSPVLSHLQETTPFHPRTLTRTKPLILSTSGSSQIHSPHHCHFLLLPLHPHEVPHPCSLKQKQNKQKSVI